MNNFHTNKRHYKITSLNDNKKSQETVFFISCFFLLTETADPTQAVYKTEILLQGYITYMQ